MPEQRPCGQLSPSELRNSWGTGASGAATITKGDSSGARLLILSNAARNTGATMEDASVDANSTRDGNEECVGALLRASDTIGALARAAAALKGLSQDPL